MKKINLTEVTERAERAALDVIDDATDGFTKKSDGPCGDALAAKLTEVIREALIDLFDDPNEAPALIKLEK